VGKGNVLQEHVISHLAIDIIIIIIIMIVHRKPSFGRSSSLCVVGGLFWCSLTTHYLHILTEQIYDYYVLFIIKFLILPILGLDPLIDDD
jgi:hypothetical protein